MADLPVNILLNATAKLGALKTLEDQTEQFGMRLRLTGRDLMRLGSTIDRFFSGIWKQWTGFLSLSDDWAVGMEDISWAFEDIAAVIGAALAPSLESIANFLELVADYLEANPWAVWVIALAAVGILVGMIVGKFLTLFGTLTLISGTIMVARRESLTFGQSLQYLKTVLTEGATQGQLYIASLDKLKRSSKETREAIEMEIRTLQARNQAIPAAIAKEQQEIAKLSTSAKARQQNAQAIKMHEMNLEELNGTLASNKTRIDQDTEALKLMEKKEKKPVSLTEKLKGAFGGVTQKGKSLIPALAKVGAGLTVVGGIGGLLFSQWEPLAELFETVGELFADLVSPLEPLIDWIINWVEENPEWAKGILAVILGLATLYILMSKFGTIAKLTQGIVGLLGNSFSSLAGGARAFGANQLKSVAALALLIAAIAGLVAAFALLFMAFQKMGVGGAEGLGIIVGLFATLLGFLWGLFAIVNTMNAMKASVAKGIQSLALLVAVISLLALAIGAAVMMIGSVKDGIPILFSLVAALTILVVTVTALALVFSAASPAIGIFVGLLIGLGVAAVLVGAGVALLGIGVQFLANAFTQVLDAMVKNLDVLPKVVALSFAMGAALMAAGAGGLVAMIGLMAAMAGFVGISVGVFAAAAAFLALAVAIGALALALNAIPEWGRGLVGGVVTGLGTVAGALTGFFGGLMGAQKGGIVSEEGLVYLHAGEVVTPAGGTSMSKYDNTFFINVTVQSDEDIKTLVEQINRYQSAKIGRTV